MHTRAVPAEIADTRGVRGACLKRASRASRRGAAARGGDALQVQLYACVQAAAAAARAPAHGARRSTSAAGHGRAGARTRTHTHTSHASKKSKCCSMYIHTRASGQCAVWRAALFDIMITVSKFICAYSRMCNPTPLEGRSPPAEGSIGSARPVGLTANEGGR